MYRTDEAIVTMGAVVEVFSYPFFSYNCIFALFSTDFWAFGAGYGSSISGSTQYPIFQLRFFIGSYFVLFTLPTSTSIFLLYFWSGLIPYSPFHISCVGTITLSRFIIYAFLACVNGQSRHDSPTYCPRGDIGVFGSFYFGFLFFTSFLPPFFPLPFHSSLGHLREFEVWVLVFSVSFVRPHYLHIISVMQPYVPTIRNDTHAHIY